MDRELGENRSLHNSRLGWLWWAMRHQIVHISAVFFALLPLWTFRCIYSCFVCTKSSSKLPVADISLPRFLHQGFDWIIMSMLPLCNLCNFIPYEYEWLIEVSNFFHLHTPFNPKTFTSSFLSLVCGIAPLVVDTLAIYLVSRIPRLHLTLFAAIIVQLTTAAS